MIRIIIAITITIIPFLTMATPSYSPSSPSYSSSNPSYSPSSPTYYGIILGPNYSPSSPEAPAALASHTSQEPLEEGYDYDFVEEPPESLKCLICLLVARDPQQHGGCGKLFCKTCIAKYRGNDCPHCRQDIRSSQTQLGIFSSSYSEASTNTTIFNDFKSNQEVKALMVYCTRKCGWEGPLESVEEHEVNDCKSNQIPCPNDCDTRVKRKDLKLHCETECPRRQSTCPECDEIMEHGEMENHMARECLKRQYTCPHCNEAGVYDELTTTHLTVCPNVEIECPKCSDPILRSRQDRHHLICKEEPARCKYYNIGCRRKPLRKNLQKHEKNAQSHLQLAIEEMWRLKKALILKNTLTFRERFSNSESDRILSSPFFTSTTGYKICIEIYPKGKGSGTDTHASVYACLMKGDHDDTLTWPFTGSVTVELLNQVEDKNHYKETFIFPADDDDISQRVVDRERGKGWGLSQFISHTALDYNASTNTQYLKDDTLVFRVSAEAPDHKPWLECTN